jgi:hypothetical protein
VRARPQVLDAFIAETGIADRGAAEDELVYQNSFRLNRSYYVRERPGAFVLSHGRDLMILKGVGYAEEIARFYRLEERTAHLWIGHQRYPTRGRVWRPGGAHRSSARSSLPSRPKSSTAPPCPPDVGTLAEGPSFSRAARAATLTT